MGAGADGAFLALFAVNRSVALAAGLFLIFGALSTGIQVNLATFLQRETPPEQRGRVFGWLSPLLGPRCRFHPSCSSYARQALSQHGLLRGGWMAAVRILRCSPLSSGGLDPVPARFHWWPSPAQEDHGCTHDHHKDPQ